MFEKSGRTSDELRITFPSTNKPRLNRRLAAICMALTGALAVTSTQASVIVHYKLDESSGTTAADAAAAGGVQNGASAAASPQWRPTDGIIGGSLRFSATVNTDVDENVSFTSATNLISAYPATLSSWVRTTSTMNSRETFVYLGDQTAGDRYLQTSRDNSNSRATNAARNTGYIGFTGGPAINDGQWHHVVGVYTSATSRSLYVDGIQVGTPDITSVTLPATTRLSIGALMRPAATDALNGDLDDVGLWDESLTSVRIALIHGLGRHAGVDLGSSAIPAVEAVFGNQTGSATAGAYQWLYATGLPSTTVGTTGLIGSDPYIVLDSSGNGVRAVPEPAAAAAMMGAAGLLLRRRRRP